MQLEVQPHFFSTKTHGKSWIQIHGKYILDFNHIESNLDKLKTFLNVKKQKEI